MSRGFCQNCSSGEARRQTPQGLKESIQFGYFGLLPRIDSVALPQTIRHLLKRPHRLRDGNCLCAKVTKAAAQERSTVPVVRILSNVAGQVGGVGMQRGASGMEKRAVCAVKPVDAVWTRAKFTARSVVLTRVQSFADKCGVDDRMEWIPFALSEGSTGKAEDTVTWLRRATDGRLTDGERKQRCGAGAWWRRAGCPAAITGEFIDEGLRHGRTATRLPGPCRTDSREEA